MSKVIFVRWQCHFHTFLDFSRRAVAKCGLKAAAEQQCGVPDCNFFFPYPGDQCNEDPGKSNSCNKQCGDGSDGAGATGLGFLTAAAAVAAAL